MGFFAFTFVMSCARSNRGWFFQRRAERIAQMRGDPYYLVDDPPPRMPAQHDDVDSIPIVRLDDMPSPEEGEYNILI